MFSSKLDEEHDNTADSTDPTTPSNSGDLLINGDVPSSSSDYAPNQTSSGVPQSTGESTESSSGTSLSFSPWLFSEDHNDLLEYYTPTGIYCLKRTLIYQFCKGELVPLRASPRFCTTYLETSPDITYTIDVVFRFDGLNFSNPGDLLFCLYTKVRLLNPSILSYIVNDVITKTKPFTEDLIVNLLSESTSFALYFSSQETNAISAFITSIDNQLKLLDKCSTSYFDILDSLIKNDLKFWEIGISSVLCVPTLLNDLSNCLRRNSSYVHILGAPKEQLFGKSSDYEFFVDHKLQVAYYDNDFFLESFATCPGDVIIFIAKDSAYGASRWFPSVFRHSIEIFGLPLAPQTGEATESKEPAKVIINFSKPASCPTNCLIKPSLIYQPAVFVLHNLCLRERRSTATELIAAAPLEGLNTSQDLQRFYVILSNLKLESRTTGIRLDRTDCIMINCDISGSQKSAIFLDKGSSLELRNSILHHTGRALNSVLSYLPAIQVNPKSLSLSLKSSEIRDNNGHAIQWLHNPQMTISQCTFTADNNCVFVRNQSCNIHKCIPFTVCTIGTSSAAIQTSVTSTRLCSNCFQEARKICGNCRNIVYCGVECQAMQWTHHSQYCTPLL